MWLLYVTFEDFLHMRHPQLAAGMKRYSGNAKTRRRRKEPKLAKSQQSETISSSGGASSWLDTATDVHTSVVETRDWLKPEEEEDDWSDDTDRVRKLSEAKTGRRLATDDYNDSSLIDSEPFLCLDNSLHKKVKRIDKGTLRNYRSKQRSPDKRAKKCRLCSHDSGNVDSNGNSLNPLSVDCRPVVGGKLPVKQCSPVTTSSGYGSDRDRDDADSILYAALPVGGDITSLELPRGGSRAYAAESRVPGFGMMQHCDSMKDISGDVSRHAELSRSRSLDSLQLHLMDQSHTSQTVPYPESMDPHVQGMSRVPYDDHSVYENLPAALYAQVSPPKPTAVYQTPNKLATQPIWESTPLDNHRPRIMNSSTILDTASETPGSAVRSQMRRRLGLLQDDHILGNKTPPVIGKPGSQVRHLQEQSIAELRTIQNGYLCMTQSKKSADSLRSVLVVDVKGNPDHKDEDVTIYAKSPDSLNSSGSTDSGRGSCSMNDQLSPTAESSIHDPTYESIPEIVAHPRIPLPVRPVRDCGARLSDNSGTNTSSEPLYCKIGDVPSICEYSDTYKAPTPPPVRTNTLPLKKNTWHPNLGKMADPKAATLTRTLSAAPRANIRVLKPQERVRASDIVDLNGYKTYTVADVLESCDRYIGEIPKPEPQGNGQYYNNGTSGFPRGSFRRSLKRVEQRTDANEHAQPDAGNSGKRTLVGMKKHFYKAPKVADNHQFHVPAQYPVTTEPQPRQQHVPEKPEAEEDPIYENIARQRQPIPERETYDFTSLMKHGRPTRRPGVNYYGQGSVTTVKKTLSFGDISARSTTSGESIEIFVDGTPPDYYRDKRGGHKSNVYVTSKTGSRGMTSSSYQSATLDLPRQRKAAAAMHHRVNSDQLTQMTAHPAEAEPVYENIRDLQSMRERRSKMATMVQVTQQLHPTPLRRSRSALQIQWNGKAAQQTEEIFC